MSDDKKIIQTCYFCKHRFDTLENEETKTKIIGIRPDATEEQFLICLKCLKIEFPELYVRLKESYSEEVEIRLRAKEKELDSN